MSLQQLRIDGAWLASLGLSRLPVSVADALLVEALSALEDQVGERLASCMSPAQLDEFEVFIDHADENGALTWLEVNLPHYKTVVAQEHQRLSDHLRNEAQRILGAFEDDLQVRAEPAQ